MYERVAVEHVHKCMELLHAIRNVYMLFTMALVHAHHFALHGYNRIVCKLEDSATNKCLRFSLCFGMLNVCWRAPTIHPSALNNSHSFCWAECNCQVPLPYIRIHIYNALHHAIFMSLCEHRINVERQLVIHDLMNVPHLVVVVEVWAR